MTYVLVFLTGLPVMALTVFILYWFGRLVNCLIDGRFEPETTHWVEISLQGFVSLVLLSFVSLVLIFIVSMFGALTWYVAGALL